MRHPKALYHAILGVLIEAERLDLDPQQTADRLMDVFHGIADVNGPAVQVDLDALRQAVAEEREENGYIDVSRDDPVDKWIENGIGAIVARYLELTAQEGSP